MPRPEKAGMSARAGAACARAEGISRPLPEARARSAGNLEKRADSRLGLGGGQNWKHLEVDEVLPPSHPLLEKRAVFALHDLEAARQVLGDPAAELAKPVRSEASPVSDAAVDGDRIRVSKLLDHEEEHGPPRVAGPSPARRDLPTALATSPWCSRAWIQPDEEPGRKTRQDPEDQTDLVVVVDAILLRPGDGDGAIVALLAVHRGLDLRVLPGASVPGAGAVVGGHVELTIALEAGHDPIVRRPVHVEGGDDQGRPGGGLQGSDQRLERGDDSHVDQRHDHDDPKGPHRLAPRSTKASDRRPPPDGSRLARGRAPTTLPRPDRARAATTSRARGWHPAPTARPKHLAKCSYARMSATPTPTRSRPAKRAMVTGSLGTPIRPK